MHGGKGGPIRKTPRANEWNGNLDKYVIKWWLQRVVIDLNDKDSWDTLRADLHLYAVRIYT